MQELFKILNYEILKYNSVKITVSTIIIVVASYFVVRLLLSLIKRGLRKYQERSNVEQGRIAAFFQIIKYIVWIIYALTSMQVLGMELTWLLASGAALMVGIGLGLQNVFNDLVSGVIILFEGSVDKGDIITVGDDMIGEVKKINIRTSHILTRNNISVIVPNHKLVEENIINWSHSQTNPRFLMKVGVAYGSPTRKVKEILLKVVEENKDIDTTPKPFVRFKDFGDSSLDFEVYFWCSHVFGIEDVISELRYCVDDEFRAAGISIPFPQRDLHIVSGLHTK